MLHMALGTTVVSVSNTNQKLIKFILLSHTLKQGIDDLAPPYPRTHS